MRDKIERMRLNRVSRNRVNNGDDKDFLVTTIHFNKAQIKKHSKGNNSPGKNNTEINNGANESQSKIHITNL